MRPRTDTHTQTRVTTIHFSWSTSHAKCIVVTRVCVSVCVSVRGRETEEGLIIIVIRQHRTQKFGEMTQNNAVQGHRFWYQSKPHIRFPIIGRTNVTDDTQTTD